MKLHQVEIQGNASGGEISLQWVFKFFIQHGLQNSKEGAVNTEEGQKVNECGGGMTGTLEI